MRCMICDWSPFTTSMYHEELVGVDIKDNYLIHLDDSKCICVACQASTQEDDDEIPCPDSEWGPPDMFIEFEEEEEYEQSNKNKSPVSSTKL